jgi:hypothetical protein
VAPVSTAPSLNCDWVIIPGLDAGVPATQDPDIPGVPNPGAAFVVASVASTGKFAVAAAVPVTGHIWMAPGALPPIGLPKLNWAVPSVPATLPGSCGAFTVPGNAGACVEAGASVELGGIVVLGTAATWAKLVP